MTHGEPDPARYVRMPDNNPSPTHYYLRLSVTALAAVVFLFLHREHELAALRAENHQLRSDVQASSKLQSLIGGVGSTQQPDSGAGSSEDSHNTCTCEEAKKSPLFLEYAYRSGLCPGAPANLGPSFATEDCLEDINAEYNFEGNFNGARPVIFNESAAHAFPVFDGVTFARLPPGEVTAQWECSKATGCHDCKPGTPQCSTERGFAMMWVPEGAEKTTARILYVHGGSWLTGSPTSASYAPFCAMIAKTSGLPVLAIDYPLAPVGKFETILEQSSPGGLPNAGGAVLGGGVLFSPWLNLKCDTPSYVSQVYKLETRRVGLARQKAGCSLGDNLPEDHDAKVAIGGDVAFTDYPFTLAAKFAENGELYAGGPALTTDPVASPIMALGSSLAKMPPVQIHIGLSEVLVAENVIFATKLAAAGAACELHTYDAMWHVFSQYYEGCEHPKLQQLLFAYSSLNLTATFLNRLASSRGKLPWKNNGIPYTLTHYEYPHGVDTAMASYHAMMD